VVANEVRALAQRSAVVGSPSPQRTGCAVPSQQRWPASRRMCAKPGACQCRCLIGAQACGYQDCQHAKPHRRPPSQATSPDNPGPSPHRTRTIGAHSDHSG
jgi:hypothetical protein